MSVLTSEKNRVVIEERRRVLKTVYKYRIPDEDIEFSFKVPGFAEFLSLDVQHGIPVMWFLVDPETMAIERSFVNVGTGWDIEAKVVAFLGTYTEGMFVHHVFEVEK